MSKFNVGDKVVCVNNKGRGDEYITEGNTYKVISVNLYDELLTVQDNTGNDQEFFTDRFIPLEQPTQECPYTLIEELQANIDNLEELISEQAERIRQVDQVLDNFTRLTTYFSTEGQGKLPNARIGDDVVEAILNYFKEDTFLQQQAECYLRLNDLLQEHESFQQSKKCRSDELADTIVLLQDTYDKYQNGEENKPTQFKPVEEYTADDWIQAWKEEWEFESYAGEVFKITGYDYSESYPVDAPHTSFTISGKYLVHQSSDRDIKHRIS